MTTENPRYSIDRYLQFLVIGANVSDGPVTTVTLTVGGMLVSGELIGASRYLQLMTESSSATSQEIEDNDRLFTELGEEQLHIHLQNARMFLGGGQRVPVAGGVLWRGRMDAVSGWFFGGVEDAEVNLLKELEELKQRIKQLPEG